MDPSICLPLAVPSSLGRAKRGIIQTNKLNRRLTIIEGLINYRREKEKQRKDKKSELTKKLKGESIDEVA